MPDPISALDSSFRLDSAPEYRSQGQAALLLLESLMHSLLDNGGLTKAQALEAIRSAQEVKAESLAEHKEPEAVLRKSLQILSDMRHSIEAHSGRYDPAAQAGPQPGQRADGFT